MKVSGLVLGKCLGCAFLAIGSLYGQTNLVQNGDFAIVTFPNAPDNWAWTAEVAFSASSTGGPNTGGYVGFKEFGSVTDLTQTITVPSDGSYKLEFYLQNPNSLNDGTFSATIGGIEWFRANVSDVGTSWALATNTKSLSAGNQLLDFSKQGNAYSSDLFKIGNVSLVAASSPSPSGDPLAQQRAAVLAANGLSGNANYTTAVNTAKVGTLITTQATQPPEWKEDFYNFAFGRECSADNGCSVPMRSKTNDKGVTISQYQDADGKWHANPPTCSESEGADTNGIPSDKPKFQTDDIVGAILPKIYIPTIALRVSFASISLNALLACKSLLTSLNFQDSKNVDLLHANIKNFDSDAATSLNTIRNLNQDINLELQARIDRYNSVNAKLGISFDLLDINALQDVDDLVVGLFDDFALGQETKIQTLKKEFRKDLAFFLHVSKSLEAMNDKLQNALSEVTNFASDHTKAIEVLQSNLVLDSLKSFKSIQVSVAKLKNAFLVVNSAFEKYSKAAGVISSLKEKIDLQAEKTREILPKLYLLDTENASASLEADLVQEIALLDVLDEELLVASRGEIDPVRQSSQAALSNLSSQDTHVWGRVLGQYMHQSKSSSSSAFSSGTGGALIGSDWKVSNHALGFAAVYMYTYLGQYHNSGHVNVNQGGLAPYGVFNVTDWKFNTSLYGGYSYNDNHRNGNTGTSKYKASSHSHAWQLAPHFQVTYSGLVKNTWYTAEPYVMGDYVASWQSSSTEKGAPSLNAKLPSNFSGFIRTESGFTFNETIRINYGQLVLREKAGWAYQRAISSFTNSVSIIGVLGAFAAPSNAFIQNLGVVEFAMTFNSWKKHVPSIEVSYEGQFGSKYISQMGSINLSKNF